MPKKHDWFFNASDPSGIKRPPGGNGPSYFRKSLGAVIILLMWFYICGLMLLIGAEINKEIEVAAMEMRLAEANSQAAVSDIGKR